jgi:hypothetical protein
MYHQALILSILMFEVSILFVEVTAATGRNAASKYRVRPWFLPDRSRRGKMIRRLKTLRKEPS